MSIESRGQSEFDDIIFSPLTCLSSFHYDRLTVFCLLYICKKVWCRFFSRSESFMSWNVWWFGADPLTKSAFHSMGLKRPRHCLRHWNETGEPQNPQTLVRVTDMPCGFVYWPKFVNGASLRPEAFPSFSSQLGFFLIPGHGKASSFYTSLEHSSNK